MLRNARSGEPFRLLWLIDSLALGGAEALTLAFARGVDPGRVRLRIVCLKAIGGNPFEAELRRCGMEVRNLGARHLRDHRAFRSLLALTRQERTERIHTHLEYASIWGCLASRLTGVPATCTLHVAPLDGRRGGRAAARQRLRVMAMNRWAAEVLAVSRWTRDGWLREAGLDPSVARVLPNGIDCRTELSSPSREELRVSLGLPPEALVVVTVAALREEKGLDLLLEAAPRVLAREPRARFLVVGDGPMGQRLLERCGQMGLAGAFRWPGFRSDARSLLPACDLFVLPTRQDALPTAVLEAMAAGLPVVATRVGGIPEIVRDGRDGLLSPAGDPEALAAAMVALLTDAEGARRRGAAGRRRALKEFSTDAWLARLEEVYGRRLRANGEADSDAECMEPPHHSSPGRERTA